MLVTALLCLAIIFAAYLQLALFASMLNGGRKEDCLWPYNKFKDGTFR
jgi:hypothetical protein